MLQEVLQRLMICSPDLTGSPDLIPGCCWDSFQMAYSEVGSCSCRHLISGIRCLQEAALLPPCVQIRAEPDQAPGRPRPESSPPWRSPAPPDESTPANFALGPNSTAAGCRQQTELEAHLSQGPGSRFVQKHMEAGGGEPDRDWNHKLFR